MTRHSTSGLERKKFPDYRRIIPDTFTYRFTVNRQDLVMVLRRLALLSPEKFKGVVLDLTEDSMEITSDNPEVGEGKELLSITAEIFEPEAKRSRRDGTGRRRGRSRS